MIKFTINEVPKAPWEKVPAYAKTIVTQEGHTYTLIKYVRRANYWERLLCALTAAWALVKSWDTHQKMVRKNWDLALGRRKLSLRCGTQAKSQPAASEERSKIKTAIFASTEQPLYEMGEAFEKQSRYEDAFKCYFLAVLFAHEPSMEAIERLQEKQHVPKIGTDIRTDYLDHAKTIKDIKADLIKKPNSKKLHRDIAHEYTYFTETGLRYKLKDEEMVAWFRAMIREDRLKHCRRAAEFGDGGSLKVLKYVFKDEKFPEVQKARMATLKKMEEEAKSTRNIDLLEDLYREYEANEEDNLALNDLEETKNWWKAIANGEPFNEHIDRLCQGDRYKQLAMRAEAAKLGSPYEMSRFMEYSYTLPKNYVAEVREAFIKAAQPKIQELLPQAENNHVEAIRELITFYKHFDKEQEVKWSARLNNLID